MRLRNKQKTSEAQTEKGDSVLAVEVHAIINDLQTALKEITKFGHPKILTCIITEESERMTQCPDEIIKIYVLP